MICNEDENKRKATKNGQQAKDNNVSISSEHQIREKPRHEKMKNAKKTIARSALQYSLFHPGSPPEGKREGS